jgi:hypothetical protein
MPMAKLNKKIPKGKLVAFILANFACISTWSFFAPLDLYLHNAGEFLINFQYIFVPLLLLCLMMTAAVILLVPIFVKGKGLEIVSLLAIGMTLAFYIQELFLNGEVQQITGDPAHYADFTSFHVLDSLLWLLVVFLPLLIWKGYDDKHKVLKWETPVTMIACVIVGMQLVGVSAAVPAYRHGGQLPTVTDPYISYDPAFALSREDNICVFLLDRLDTQYFHAVLESHPELSSTFDGFTYYDNNTAEFLNTFPSVTKMLTDHYYDAGDSIDEYWAKAWSEPSFIDTLVANGYDPYLYPDRLSTYGTYEQIAARTNNLKQPLTSQYTINYGMILSTSYRLSLIRLLPYQFKDYFYDLTPDFANEFYDWTIDDKLLPVIGNQTDRRFFERLKEVGLSAENTKKIFLFLHFNASHDGGYHYEPLTNTLENMGSYLDTTYGAFMILAEYFEQLKDLGIYDNSTIIILADHGRPAYEMQIIENTQLNSPITSCLMVKPRDARGELVIDQVMPMSNAYLGASVLEYAGLPHAELGTSYNDIIDGKQILSTRGFYMYWWPDPDTVIIKGRYEITGDANDFANWHYQPVTAMEGGND